MEFDVIAVGTGARRVSPSRRGGRVAGVHTDPQVAGVGLSEREAKAKCVTCEVAIMSFANVVRAIDEKAGPLEVLPPSFAEGRARGGHGAVALRAILRPDR